MRRIWPIVSISLALLLARELWTNKGTRETAELSEKLILAQEQRYALLLKASTTCESTLMDVAQRLGLDTEGYPLVATNMWRQIAHGMGIRRARSKLGASAWQKDPPMGWPDPHDGAKSGIGGGE